MRTRPKSQKLREVSMPRRPFGAGEMALEGSPRAIRFAVRVDVQHDSRDLAPVGTFQDRRRQNRGGGMGFSLFIALPSTMWTADRSHVSAAISAFVRNMGWSNIAPTHPRQPAIYNQPSM